MLDGLGMAETTPGPLIQVVQFVGFLGAYRNPGPLTPLMAGIAGSVVTTWVTYSPCFLWIFLGAPYIEALRGRAALNAALSAVTAAVVGVILNLSIWFAMHTVFGSVTDEPAYGIRLLVPDWSTVDWMSVAIACGALVAMLRLKVGMIPTLVAAAAIGALYHAVLKA
jgi:chromate transporter